MRSIYSLNAFRPSHAMRLTYLPTRDLHHRQSAVFQHKALNFFQVVYEVENYHKFLPWCSNSIITKRHNPLHFEAELFVNFKIYSDSYTSRVTCNIDESMQKYTIVSESNMAAVKSLRSTWAISAVDKNTCKVDYDIDFEFKKGAYQALAQIFLNTLVHTINGSFIDRVKSLERSNYFTKNPLQIFQKATPAQQPIDIVQRQQSPSTTSQQNIDNIQSLQLQTTSVATPTQPTLPNSSVSPTPILGEYNYTITTHIDTMVQMKILSAEEAKITVKSINSNAENRETAQNAYKFFIIEKGFIGLSEEDSNWKFLLALRSITLFK